MTFPLDDQAPQGAPIPPFYVPVVRRKFQSRLWLHLLLCALTLVTTTVAGAVHYLSFVSNFGRTQIALNAGLLVQGLWYSLTILGILGAHEMGHYLYCRRYGVDASPPYFIPMPPLIFMTGTLGAVIRIREPFPTRKVLFDIGIAGPLAGFAVLVPTLFYGMSLSTLVPMPTSGEGYTLGEPLLFQLAAYTVFGTPPPGFTINMHPMVFASWFGMLATYWNLLPFGQFDGGHLTHAAFGRGSRWITIVTALVAVLMTYFSISWLLMTVLMLLMLWRMGPDHPPVMNPYEPFPTSRYVLFGVALLVFVLCFMPVPLAPEQFGTTPARPSQNAHGIDVDGGAPSNLRP
ncbi:MAG: site-2 protease family protein [Vicinamibacterales bacterium]